MKTIKFVFVLTAIFLFYTSSNIFSDELKVIKEKRFSVKENENLNIESTGTDVKIENWNKLEVYVKVMGNKKAEEKLKFELEQSENEIDVYVKRKNSFFNLFNNNIQSKIIVMVPTKFNVKVETSGGDIYMNEITGNINLYTSGGDIKLKNLIGKINAETSGGDIMLENINGEKFLSTSGGDINCKQIIGNLKAKTSGGDINIEAIDGKIFAETSGGDIKIDYAGENKGIKANTSGGNIHLLLPKEFKAKVHLETFAGEIENNFKNSRTTKVKRSELIAEFNNGTAILEASTSGGNIIVDEK